MNLGALNGKPLAAVKTLVFIAALTPLLKLVAGAFLDALGANPIEKITRITGYWTLSFLLITLSVTPLRRLTSWAWPIRLRRMLGLFAFFYGSLHFLTYLVLDQFFDWQDILKDIVKRPYITIGFPSYLLMIPLALTSTDGMIRRLGGKRWRLLHRLTYLSATGGVIHYGWLVKKDIASPLTFAMALTVLLGFRAITALIRYRAGTAGRQSAEKPSR